MLKYIKYSMISGLILLGSCKEDQDFIPDYYWGEASALKNGEEWNPEVTAIKTTDGKFSIIFEDYIEDHGAPFMEKLSITPLPFSNGTYGLFNEMEHGQVRASFTSVFGDVVGDRYDTYNHSSNYVEIREYDAGTREIQGTFGVTLVLSKVGNFGGRPTPPDTLRLTNGTFHTKIRDNW